MELRSAKEIRSEIFTESVPTPRRLASNFREFSQERNMFPEIEAMSVGRK